MSELRRCSEHGFFEGEQCPACERSGWSICSAERRRRCSKFLSGALRHFPDDAGLELDDRGWTDFDDLVDAVTAKYQWATDETVMGVIATDPKGRFERHEDRVRAAYGHSVDVDLESADGPVPDELYHGTTPDALEAIEREGIQPMSRQLVHLSGTVDAAQSVGARHADDPLVLRIDADGMQADGHRITKRGVEVFTTEHVPADYLLGTVEELDA